MKLSPVQSTLIRLMNTPPTGVWYPHPYQWLDGNRIIIHGTAIAMAIKALWRKGLAEPIPELHPYASKITDKGKEIAELEKGKPTID